MKPRKPSDRKQKEFMQIWRSELLPVYAELVGKCGWDAVVACQHVAWTLFKLMREHRKN